MPAWPLKVATTEIVPHRTMVTNEYLKEQIYSSISNKGLIKPLYINNDPPTIRITEQLQYRANCGKNLNKLLQKQIIQNLSSGKLLTHLEFGFREKISSQDALNQFTESTRKHVDQNDSVSSVCIDL